MPKQTKNHSSHLFEGQEVPHSAELEMNVVGGCIVDNSLIDRVSPIIQPKHFYHPPNRMVFEAILKLRNDKHVVDIVTLVESLKEQGNLKAVGGPAYIAELSTAFTSADSIVYSATKVRENWIRRDIILLGYSMKQQAVDPTITAEVLLQKLQSEVDELAQFTLRQEGSPLTSFVEEAYQFIEDVKNKKKITTGILTGYHELDKLTGGFHPGELIIIAGRPSHGKTSLALDICRRITHDEQYQAGLWSLEMSGLELALKQVCAECRVDLSKLRAGKITSHEYGRVKKEMKRVMSGSSRITINDSGTMDVLTLCAEARKLKKQKGINIIVIDYLQLMNAFEGWRGDRHLEIAFITRQLKRLAKELDIPVIALSQLSRKIEDRAGVEKRPQLSDLRESGAIEQDADVVIFVHRPEMYLRQDDINMVKWKGIAEVVIGKQRNGAIGDFFLTFLHEYATFENYQPPIDSGKFANQMEEF